MCVCVCLGSKVLLCVCGGGAEVTKGKRLDIITKSDVREEVLNVTKTRHSRIVPVH